jgi:hypothetical protein
MKVKKSIIVNGKEYESLDAVPEKFKDLGKHAKSVLTTPEFADLKQVISTVFNQSKEQFTEPQAQETIHSVQVRQSGGSFVSSALKISIGVFIGLAIMYFYFSNGQQKNVTQSTEDSVRQTAPVATSDNIVEEPQPEAVAATPPGYYEDELILEIEDKNEPPYKMFIVGKKNEEIFRLEMPDSELIESQNDFMYLDLTNENAATDPDGHFRISVEKGDCDTRDATGVARETVEKNGTMMLYTMEGDSGMSQRFMDHFYSTEVAGHCVTFALEDRANSEYNPEARRIVLENLISSLRFKTSADSIQ